MINQNNQVIETKAGFATVGGNVINFDGGAVKFYNLVANNNYSFVVYHRNHIPVKTATNYFYAQNMYINLTNPIYVKGQNLIDMGNNLKAMKMGNVNSDNSIDAADRNSLKVTQENSFIYSTKDVNLDGVVDAIDRNFAKIQQESTSSL